jgi:cytochrome c-type biogenesis protein CcmH
MLFWIIAALLTLGACLSVLVPVVRAGRPVAATTEHDIEVYRDQLAEIERDAARGLIAAAEAEQARAEIGRRILRLAESGAETQTRGSMNQGWRWTAMAGVLAVPFVSWGIYTVVGSPEIPSQPLQERLTSNPGQDTIGELIARAEGHLAQNPGDGRGWEVLAPVYLRIGRFADAQTAFRHSMTLLGATAAREAGLGEAIAAGAGGIVNADAQAAFERALALEPGHPKARFFLATAFAQEGRISEAENAFRTMLAKLPADSPWRGAVEQALSQINDRREAEPDGSLQSGPGQDEVEAAAQMSAGEQSNMIEAMVAKLDQRLRDNPQDLEGWKRLVRSYTVLDKRPEAEDALSRGAHALGGESEAAAELEEFAAALGVAARKQE